MTVKPILGIDPRAASPVPFPSCLTASCAQPCTRPHCGWCWDSRAQQGRPGTTKTGLSTRAVRTHFKRTVFQDEASFTRTARKPESKNKHRLQVRPDGAEMEGRERERERERERVGLYACKLYIHTLYAHVFDAVYSFFSVPWQHLIMTYLVMPIEHF